MLLMTRGLQMKSIFLFGTRLRMFICEIPAIFLLCVSIYFNDSVDTSLKLYPLIVVLCGAIIFMLVFLMRGISISFEGVRSVGLFSSRDSVMIKKGRKLVITLKRRKKMYVEVYGVDDAPGFDWMRKDDVEPREANLYRDRTVGGRRQILRVLSYFGIERDLGDKIVASDTYTDTYEYFDLSKSRTEGVDTYTFTFTETV